MLLKSRSWGCNSRPHSFLARHGPSQFFSCFPSPSSSSSSSSRRLSSSPPLSRSSLSRVSCPPSSSSSRRLSSSPPLSRSSLSRVSCPPSPGISTFSFSPPSSLSTSLSTSVLPSSHASRHPDDPVAIPKSSYLQNTHLRHLCKNVTLRDACSFFSVIDKDLFSWNIMMSEFVRLERSDECLRLFNQMQNEGMVPNKFIFATILSACATHEEVGPGIQIHARIESNEEGFTTDPVVQTALVNMYGRFGELRIARQIFEGDPGQDVALWNAILTVYTQHGKGKISWSLYLHMQQLGVLQNKVTCIIMLSVCSSEAALKQGKKLHAWVEATRLEHDIVVGTALINMYSKCYSLETTHTIFDGILHRDLIVWNALISGCALNEMYKDVFYYFNQMQQEGVMPSEVTCTSILDGCASPKALNKGKLIHARVVGMDLETKSVARAALVNMYGKCGNPYKAVDLFNEMSNHGDSVLWNTMISTYAKLGMYGKSMQLYTQMVKEGIVADRVTFISILSLITRETDLDGGRRVHNKVTHLGLDLDTSVGNVLVSMYSQCGSLPDALVVFNKMSCQDAVTFVNVITACTTQAALAEGKRIHSCIEGTEMEHNIVLGNALVNMYSKCGSLVDAQRIFERMPKRNVVSWSIIIAAYAQHGEGKRAFCLFAQMRERCIVPDNVTLASLLVACSHAGDLKEAHDFFHFISGKYPTIALDHVNCMIDLLGRSGSLDFADHLVNCMPFSPNSLSWSMLVCACHVHADLDRGYLAAEYAFELDSDDSTIYVLLSNMCGAFGKDS